MKVYFPYFDYVRFIAASIVMLGHSKIITMHDSGAIAVDVFFALSGWLIGSILLNLKKEDLPRFYFNRAVRIWIPYFVALILLISVSLIKDTITPKWIEIVFYKITFVYNIFGTPQLADFVHQMPLDGTGNHYWSVNAEEQFYLLSPLLLVVIGRFGRSPVLWIFLSLASWYMYLYTPIFFGVTAAVLVNQYGKFYTHQLCKLASIIAILITVSLFLEGIDYRIISPVFSIAVILILAIEGNPSKIGKFLGGISYPLYLNHWIGVFAANFLMKESVFNPAFAMLSNYLIVAVMYMVIDKPCLAARSKLYNENRAKIITTLAYSMVIIGIGGGLYLK